MVFLTHDDAPGVSYDARDGTFGVGCDELSLDAARAHRWRPAGQPGLFFVLCVTKRPVHFRAPRARHIKQASS